MTAPVRITPPNSGPLPLEAIRALIQQFSRAMPPATLRDSLFAITGQPVSVDQVDPNSPWLWLTKLALTTGQPAAGTYNGLTDVVTLGSDNPSVLSHELGHRMDPSISSHVQDPELHQRFLQYIGDRGNPQQRGYAGTNLQEHFADAFASAIQFLRDFNYHPRSYPNIDEERQWVENNLRSRESEITGVAPIVDYLLDQPLYARHPLQSLRSQHLGHLRPPSTVPQRDETRVQGYR